MWVGANGDGFSRDRAGDGNLTAGAEPASPSLHGVRAEIYEARRAAEQSLMSIGIFSAGATGFRQLAGADDGNALSG